MSSKKHGDSNKPDTSRLNNPWSIGPQRAGHVRTSGTEFLVTAMCENIRVRARRPSSSLAEARVGGKEEKWSRVDLGFNLDSEHGALGVDPYNGGLGSYLSGINLKVGYVPTYFLFSQGFHSAATAKERLGPRMRHLSIVLCWSLYETQQRALPIARSI